MKHSVFQQNLLLSKKHKTKQLDLNSHLFTGQNKTKCFNTDNSL